MLNILGENKFLLRKSYVSKMMLYSYFFSIINYFY